MMQRQHFELIAEVIRDMPLVNCATQADVDAARFHQRNAADRFADKLAKVNLGFDRARFLKACGLDTCPLTGLAQ